MRGHAPVADLADQVVLGVAEAVEVLVDALVDRGVERAARNRRNSSSRAGGPNNRREVVAVAVAAVTAPGAGATRSTENRSARVVLVLPADHCICGAPIRPGLRGR